MNKGTIHAIKSTNKLITFLIKHPPPFFYKILYDYTTRSKKKKDIVQINKNLVILLQHCNKLSLAYCLIVAIVNLILTCS
ncbi:hypothetical protein HMPREF1982_01174 [Clostridiales bacterium oral taxon 876 str. F0540]|nr:hypothetical protein HMPREF1982_01174 [Clostridiales bacterium oral taxon 876 str. F0540]